MKLKLKDAINSLDYDDLVRVNQDLREGGHELRSMIEQNIVEKERESGKTCHVCSSEINQNSPQNYTITLGPEGLKRKASFCALDCLKFFITNLEKRNEEIKRRLDENNVEQNNVEQNNFVQNNVEQNSIVNNAINQNDVEKIDIVPDDIGERPYEE